MYEYIHNEQKESLMAKRSAVFARAATLNELLAIMQQHQVLESGRRNEFEGLISLTVTMPDATFEQFCNALRAHQALYADNKPRLDSNFR